MKFKISNKSAFFWISLCFFVFFAINQTIAYPLHFVDSSGKQIIITQKPQRVVSLVPSITEIIFQLGAQEAVQAITYHSVYPPETAKKRIIGGFFSPSLSAIEKIKPDLIFYAQLQKDLKKRFENQPIYPAVRPSIKQGIKQTRKKTVNQTITQIINQNINQTIQLINFETGSLDDSYKQILLLGKIFNKEEKAREIVDSNKRKLEILSQKIAKIPLEQKKRVIRLMGRKEIMAPGDNSFQNDLIRAAGGIAPKFGKNGKIITLSLEEWQKFNPQVIYGCGGDRKTANNFLSRPYWKDVEAVKNQQIFYFPCDLTCRAATNTGYFAGWLAARVYSDEFGLKDNLALPQKIFKIKPININLDYVAKARIAYSHIYDFENKTLIIDFKNPVNLVSTLEGRRTGITSIGNHYFPPQIWGIGHHLGLKGLQEKVYRVIGKDAETASYLFTGANMDHLSLQTKDFKKMRVFALVTAGVKSNAIRTSKDKGRWYEPGTINIIIMTNMQLSDRAQTRAIITATEAKTAALLDMDIRSSENSKHYSATGTGTDNIIIVQGTKTPIDATGGHTKMGELIAKTVYHGVKEAVYKQNGIITQRNIFQRLKERQITLFDIVDSVDFKCAGSKSKLIAAVQNILLDPYYADFLKSSMALSDAYEQKLITNLGAYEALCRDITRKIGGNEPKALRKISGENKKMPLVMKMAFDSILDGIGSCKND